MDLILYSVGLKPIVTLPPCSVNSRTVCLEAEHLFLVWLLSDTDSREKQRAGVGHVPM